VVGAEREGGERLRERGKRKIRRWWRETGRRRKIKRKRKEKDQAVVGRNGKGETD
jgi:hypothetical protein